MIVRSLLLTILAVGAVHANNNLTPKMAAEAVTLGRRLATTAAPLETTISTSFLEHCVPGVPVNFPVSAGEGKGMIGLVDNPSADVSLVFSAGSLEIEPDKVPNVFSAMYVSLHTHCQL